MSQIHEHTLGTHELARTATLNLMSAASALALAIAIGPVALAAPTSPNPLVRGVDDSASAEDTVVGNPGGVHSTSAGKHRTFGILAKPLPKPKPNPDFIDKPKPVDSDRRGEEKQPVHTGTALPKSGQAQATAAVPVDPCIQTLVFDDCNSNGVSDGCDLSAGFEDADGNGVIDTCQFALGDLDLDHAVDARDLAMLLVRWETIDSDRDPNGDGIINGADLAIILSNWSLDS